MKARSLSELLQLPVGQRHTVMAAGLAALLEHVQTLMSDCEFLFAADRKRSAMSLNLQAEEEAAKVLILLDQARLGWKRQAVVATHLKRFANHLARGIYAHAADGRPADLREVRRIVDRLRVSHYLDGPNDVDWVFRNEIWARREEALYVDYVVTDEGRMWMSPADKDDWPFNRSYCTDLALALGRAGAGTEAGLDIIATHWDGAMMDDDTRWNVVDELNRKVLADLEGASLTTPEFTGQDLQRILEHWNFPLYELDLSLIEVTEAELRQKQDAWAADQYF